MEMSNATFLYENLFSIKRSNRQEIHSQISQLCTQREHCSQGLQNNLEAKQSERNKNENHVFGTTWSDATLSEIAFGKSHSTLLCCEIWTKAVCDS